MNKARCLEDGKEYTAEEFITKQTRKKRDNLTCPECGNSVFFKKTSITGTSAHFAIKDKHKTSCSLYALRKKPTTPIEPQQLRPSGAGTIIINLDSGSKKPNPLQPISPDSPVDPNNPQRPRDPKVTPNINDNKERSQNLNRLLKNLIEDPNYSNSNGKIKYPPSANIEIPFKEFFINMRDVGIKDIGKIKGIWGEISSRVPSTDRYNSSNIFWLNSGDLENRKEKFSFCLSDEIVEQIKKKHQLRPKGQLRELKESNILVIGEVKISSNNKLYCMIESIDNLAIRRKKES